MTGKWSRREEALELLAGRTAFGAAFFEVAAEAIVAGLDYRWGGVALLNPERRGVELLSLYERHGGHRSHRYELADSPCEQVYGAGTDLPHIFIPDGVAKRYPNVAGLGRIGAVCYRGEVFCGPDGNAAGHVFAIDTLADVDDPDSRAFFRLVTQRVGAEYNRWRAEEALKLGEERTRAAEQRLRDAVECLSDGFALYDSNDALVLFNSKWADLYGYSDEDASPGVSYEDLVRLDAENGAIAGDGDAYIRQRLAFRRRFQGSFDLQLRDGRWITIRESPTSECGIVGIQSDITDRMEAVESLLLEKAAAERTSEAKTRFIARISHELRTPLNAITGFAEIIRSATFGPVGNAKYQEYAGDIVTSAEHMLNLVNSLLDLAKVESGAEELREETVDIAETVRAAIVFVREKAADKGVAIDLYLPREIPKLRADPGKLKQILINLLANGIKYTDPGGKVTVHVRCSHSAGILFEIADNGPGIAEQDIDKALREYGQVPVPGSVDEEGTGLGLPLARLFTALHGGELELDSIVGIGTLVTVRLPWDRAIPGEESRRSSAS